MKFRASKSGQGMTEYIIIIAVIAIGCLLIAALFGKQIKGVFSREGNAIAGKVDSTESDANTALMKAEAGKVDSMNSFDKDATKGQQ